MSKRKGCYWREDVQDRPKEACNLNHLHRGLVLFCSLPFDVSYSYAIADLVRRRECIDLYPRKRFEKQNRTVVLVFNDS